MHPREMYKQARKVIKEYKNNPAAAAALYAGLTDGDPEATLEAFEKTPTTADEVAVSLATRKKDLEWMKKRGSIIEVLQKAKNLDKK